LQINEMF